MLRQFKRRILHLQDSFYDKRWKKEDRYGKNLSNRSCLCYLNIDCNSGCKKKKIPSILLGILFFCAVLSGFIFPEISWLDRIAGGILVSVVFFDRDMDSTGSILGQVMSSSWRYLVLCSVWGENLTAFGFATALAALYCLPGILRRDRKKESEIAFGPFLCVGILLSIFFGKAFIRWYIS